MATAKKTPASEKAPAKKPAPRKAAAKPAAAAVDKQEGGAKAPVSLSGDQSSVANKPATPDSTQPADSAPDLKLDTPRPGVFFSPIGRFPENWTPTPGAEGTPRVVTPEEWKKMFGERAGAAPEVAADAEPDAAEEDPADAEEEQTDAEEPSAEAPELSAWSIAPIAEFPALLNLANNTPAILVIQALAIRVLPFQTIQAQCASAKQFESLRQHFTKRAVQGRWNSEKGLQVTHVEN